MFKINYVLAPERLRLEDCETEASLDYIVRPRLQKTTTTTNKNKHLSMY
jgi:hypothetical protein